MTLDPKPKPRPVLDIWNQPFWEGCKSRRLLLQRCCTSGKFWFPPGPVSPYSGKDTWDWEEVSGRGEIWSFVRFHQKYFDGFADDIPYVVVMVKLEEGPFLLTHLHGSSHDEIRIGAAVSVIFEERPDGIVLPQFSLEEQEP